MHGTNFCIQRRIALPDAGGRIVPCRGDWRVRVILRYSHPSLTSMRRRVADEPTSLTTYVVAGVEPAADVLAIAVGYGVPVVDEAAFLRVIAGERTRVAATGVASVRRDRAPAADARTIAGRADGARYMSFACPSA